MKETTCQKSRKHSNTHFTELKKHMRAHIQKLSCERSVEVNKHFYEVKSVVKYGLAGW